MLTSMRVMVLASQKGGSGKTTLSGHLAVQADRNGEGPVALIDTDRTSTTARRGDVVELLRQECRGHLLWGGST